MMLTNFVGKGFIVTRASQLRALARRFFDRQARAPPGLSSTSERAALPALPSLPPSSSRADRPGARAPAPSPPPDRRAGAARPERQPEEGRAWRLRGARDGESPTAATGLRLRASQETAGGRALDARHAGASRAAGAIEGGRAASAARRAAELRRVEGVRGSMIL
ncbi:unnamed protein product, partial [Prorocentrum cordatum]